MKGRSLKNPAVLFFALLFPFFLFSACSEEKTDEKYVFSPLTVAVFADVQLEKENVGNTRNAYLTLKNHLKYAKSTGADVVFMPGDIVNKADENCYLAYEKAIKTVYGTNETEYPEFILCMGNHEWWGPGEVKSNSAVSLFDKYAKIDTENLVKKSAVKYSLDENSTLPTYYKVVCGIPFLVISGTDCDGRINSVMKEEIAGWLKEINELPSVKAGGPIFVAYHYAIPDVTYKGEGSNTFGSALDDLMKGYRNAIVFTGDTHFNAVNERTINQTDYTSINIGSSSYSRNMSMSAGYYQFDNVGHRYGGENRLEGEVGFKFEYTPTMQVATVNASGKTTIDRFYTADDLGDVKHIGMTWEIDPENFIYTNKRISSLVWANRLYGKDGLIWSADKTVRYNVEAGKMLVSFDDVTDHNCAEHYRIKVQDADNEKNVKYYDYTGNYYKYDTDPHTYHFILDDIPAAERYSVTVTAYDFYDNPSLNVLSSDVVDETLLFPDEIDVAAAETYCDISTRVNYENTASGSNSSLEYYYRGISPYTGGMNICQVIFDSDVGINEHLSYSGTKLTLKVKNLNAYEIRFGLTVIVNAGNGRKRTVDDFSSAHCVGIAADGEWTTVVWDLEKEYNIRPEDVYRLSLKVAADSSAVDTENGYEMSFLLDDIDISGD